MNPIRFIGYACLALLTALMLLLTGLSIVDQNWPMMAISLGSLMLFAFLGYGLWLEGFKQRHPHVTVAPNRALPKTLLIILGMAMGGISFRYFMDEKWIQALADLAASVFLLREAYRTSVVNR